MRFREPPLPIHVYVPGAPDEPCLVEEVDGIIVHRGPPLHPDDCAVVDGIPCTSPSRTLIDLAECVPPDELRGAFARAAELGMLDLEALDASLARVDWRPTLPLVHAVVEEYRLRRE